MEDINHTISENEERIMLQAILRRPPTHSPSTKPSFSPSQNPSKEQTQIPTVQLFGLDSFIDRLDINLKQHPENALLSDGGFVSVWQAKAVSGFYNIYMRIFDKNGYSSSETEVKVSSDDLVGDQTNPVVTSLSGESFVIAWVNNGLKVIAQAFNKTGEAIGHSINVNANSGVCDDTYSNGWSAVSPISAKTFQEDVVIFTWAGWQGINNYGRYCNSYYHLFDFSEGKQIQLLSTEKLISQSNTNTRFFPQISLKDSYSGIITFLADDGVRGLSCDANIHSVNINYPGVLGIERSKISDSLECYGRRSSLAVGNDYFTVFMWEQRGAGGNWQIVGKTYDILSQTYGSVFKVSYSESFHNVNPSAISINGDKIIVAWQQFQTNSNNLNVKAVIINFSGSLLKQEFKINNDNNYNSAAFDIKNYEKPSVIKLQEGLIITWSCNSFKNICIKRYDDSLNEINLILTQSPTNAPSYAPTVVPTVSPSASPSTAPSVAPTVPPSASPSAAPTVVPTASPSALPTTAPTVAPTDSPSALPSTAPTAAPTDSPSASPSAVPTVVPTQPVHPLVSAQITVLINLSAKEYMSDYVKLELAIDNNNYCTTFENGLNEGKFANINYTFTCKESFKLRALEGDSSDNKIVDSFKLINSAEETCLIDNDLNKFISLKGQGREYLINYQLTLKNHPTEADTECNKTSNPESKIEFRSDICKKGPLLKPPIHTDTNGDRKEDWICEYIDGTIELCNSDGSTELKCSGLTTIKYISNQDSGE